MATPTSMLHEGGLGPEWRDHPLKGECDGEFRISVRAGSHAALFGD